MDTSEAEERYQALFNSLDCIYLHDLEGRFIDANPAALELLGYEREDIPSLDLSALLDDEQLARARGWLTEVIRTGALKTAAEFVVRRKNGDPVSLEIRAGVISRGGEP